MAVDYNRVKFPTKKKDHALWSGLVNKEINRFIKQLFHMTTAEIKWDKKIQETLYDKESGICAITHYTWSKSMTDEPILIIHFLQKVKC